MKTNYLLWIGAAIVLYIVWTKVKAATPAAAAPASGGLGSTLTGLLNSGGGVSGILSTIDGGGGSGGGSDGSDDFDDDSDDF